MGAGPRAREGHDEKGLDPERKAEAAKRLKQGREECVALTAVLWQNSVREERVQSGKRETAQMSVREHRPGVVVRQPPHATCGRKNQMGLRGIQEAASAVMFAGREGEGETRGTPSLAGQAGTALPLLPGAAG